MSEVLGSFSADPAALFTVNKNLVTNELSLAFQKDGNPICLFMLINICFWEEFQPQNTKTTSVSAVRPGSISHGCWITLAL